MEETTDIRKISRRQFLYWIIPITGSILVVYLFKFIYSGIFNAFISKKNVKKSSVLPNQSKKKILTRKSWSIESLVLNTKTNVIHYPSKKIFTYYDTISRNHIQTIPFDSWQSQIVDKKHFNVAKSGIILEKLALRELNNPISDLKIEKALKILTIAFNKQYHTKNVRNWRLYDLMIQLLAVHSAYDYYVVKKKFFSTIKLVDYKNLKGPKKNSWMRSDAGFKIKIDYIHKRIDEYKSRLEKRATI